MTHDYDILIIGAGLTGATIARLTKDAGYEPLVVERRPYPGGNIRDIFDPETHITYCLHGPHYFRTNNNTIVDFIKRFATWKPYYPVVKSYVLGKNFPWPLSESFLKQTYSDFYTNNTNNTNHNKSTPKTFDDICRLRFPTEAYELFIKPYTEKQWGKSVTELLPSLANRIPINPNNNTNFSQHKYQLLPVEGYSFFIDELLEDINVEYNFTVTHSWCSVVRNKPIVITAPIDEFFDVKFGKLPYRAQQRNLYKATMLDTTPQINFPNPCVPAIRNINWGALSNKNIYDETLLTDEVPFTPSDFENCEYPVPVQSAHNLYNTYHAYASEFPNYFFVGRLGEYRYLDMDQAIARAFTKFTNNLLPVLKGN